MKFALGFTFGFAAGGMLAVGTVGGMAAGIILAKLMEEQKDQGVEIDGEIEITEPDVELTEPLPGFDSSEVRYDRDT